MQAFQETLTPLYPGSAVTEYLPAVTSVGPNYDLHGQTSYAVSPHWFVGGSLAANNSRNYSAVSAQFSIHYLFRSQPSTVATPTGMFPNDGMRPFTVP